MLVEDFAESENMDTLKITLMRLIIGLIQAFII